MIITRQKEKLINAIVFFAKKTKYCGLTKLMKLLYYLDFEHFSLTGFSVTEQDYYTYDFGPVPKEVHKELKSGIGDLSHYVAYISKEDESGGIVKVKDKIKFNDKYFSERELELIVKIADFYKEIKAKDMTKATHFPDGPWDYTKNTKGLNKKIDYALALKETTFKNKLSQEEIKERNEDRRQIKALFNAPER